MTDKEIQKEWYEGGENYTTAINEMVEFGEKNGWENWKGEEPADNRSHLADSVIEKLREANNNGTVDSFREQYPPSHSPLIKYFNDKGQSIEQMFFIEDDKIVFIVGASYEERQAYLLDNKTLIKLDSSIQAIGKSMRNNIFAVKAAGTIITTNGWQGETIEVYNIDEIDEYGMTIMTPFNDGKRVLCVTTEGTFIVSKGSVKMINPIPDPDDDEWEPYVSMENGALSNDNRYIVIGDQDTNHRILTADGEQIGEVGPQSSYPHFCLFSADDEQLISNSCHFYNGMTIGVNSSEFHGLEIDEYDEDGDYTVIDDGMRVYVGLATKDYYILGDAYGYIRACDKEGRCIWRHFLGSTIGGIAISDDEKTLWVGSCTGIIHKLKLGGGHRDTHTIGSGEHYEDFRLILWKDEDKELWW
ncbi:MAG: hypothetical protein N4A72_08840 [Bacteroidales bacterium]|jgi:hypothetical protein|nr:hypothetical protein [Bacteroidales bacterium]